MSQFKLIFVDLVKLSNGMKLIISTYIKLIFLTIVGTLRK